MGDDFRRFDPVTLARSMRPDATEVDLISFHGPWEDFKRNHQRGFVFLEFPNVINDGALSFLKSHYKLNSIETVSRDGYFISAYVFGPLTD